MRNTFLILLSLIACVSGADKLPGWVVACEVLPDEESAREAVGDLESYHVDAGCLWIPDWPSLSGSEGWLVYVGPYEEWYRAEGEACRFLWRYPDCYAIYVGPGTERRTAPPRPSDLWGLRDLIPPVYGWYYSPEETPAGWEIEVGYPDLAPPDRPLEEWEQPSLVRSSGHGWEIESWVDCYVGVVEVRARRRPLPGEGLDDLFDFAYGFIVEHGGRMASGVESREGEWILVTMDPEPEAKLSDIEFWLFRHPDALEYGWSIRSFYGETPYSRPYIPEEARERPF